MDTATLTAAVVREITLRAAEAAFGDVTALEERPGLQSLLRSRRRIFRGAASDLPGQRLAHRNAPGRRYQWATGCRAKSSRAVRSSSALTRVIRRKCSVQTGNCPGNELLDSVCARVPDIANGDSVMLSGVNFT